MHPLITAYHRTNQAPIEQYFAVELDHWYEMEDAANQAARAARNSGILLQPPQPIVHLSHNLRPGALWHLLTYDKHGYAGRLSLPADCDLDYVILYAECVAAHKNLVKITIERWGN